MEDAEALAARTDGQQLRELLRELRGRLRSHFEGQERAWARAQENASFSRRVAKEMYKKASLQADTIDSQVELAERALWNLQLEKSRRRLGDCEAAEQEALALCSADLRLDIANV